MIIVLNYVLYATVILISIWAFSGIQQDHRNSQKLLVEYKKLINIYEITHMDGTRDFEIAESKEIIKWKENHNYNSIVKQDISRYIWSIVVALLLMGINEALREVARKKNSNNLINQTGANNTPPG